MKRFSYFWLILVALGCSSVKIKGVDQSENFSISKFKTFGFFEIGVSGDAIGENYRENIELLKSAITKQMNAKGLELGNASADLLVNIGITVSEEIQTRQTNFSNPADRQMYVGQRNYTWQSQEVAVGTYKQGSVTLDFVDRANNTMVWQGTAESVLPNKAKNIPSLINEGMEKLFDKIN